MCNLSEGVFNKGIEKGIDLALVASIKSLMANLNLSLEQAMDALGVTTNDRGKYIFKYNVI